MRRLWALLLLSVVVEATSPDARAQLPIRFDERLIMGGDTSYAGMFWHEGLFWISYYSSHEGKSAIYLAKVEAARG